MRCRSVRCFQFYFPVKAFGLFIPQRATRGRSKTIDFDSVAFQRVLDDSAQIRSALQGFSSVLREISQVCDVTALQEQLLTADSRVAEVQAGFTAPLSQLQHAVTVSRPSLSCSVRFSSINVSTDDLVVVYLEGGSHRERSEGA